ncbi:LysR family transcriptional regulator, partial [Rhizobium ruizarguesonis]
MYLSSIEIFLAVASDRSVTKAAKAVGRVPSNVTTRVHQLEEDLGVSPSRVNVIFLPSRLKSET